MGHKGQEAKERVQVREEEEGEGGPPRGVSVENIHGGGHAPPPEENAVFSEFSPERAHLLLQGVY